MNLRFLTLACLVTCTTFAADAPKLPAIPTEVDPEIRASSEVM